VPGKEITPVMATEIDDWHQRATERLARYWSRGDFAYQSGAGALVTHWPKRASRVTLCQAVRAVGFDSIQRAAVRHEDARLAADSGIDGSSFPIMAGASSKQSQGASSWGRKGCSALDLEPATNFGLDFGRQCA
jgi:hypothetical protein